MKIIQHSALPWSIDRYGRILGAEDKRAGQCNMQHLIARMIKPNSDVEANASFIVKAVNSHEELVSALTSLLQHFEGNQSLAAQSGLNVNCYIPEVIKAKQALKLSKGE